MKPAPISQMRFRDELKDFFYFLRHPRSARRLPGRVQGDGWYLDWFAPLPWKRLLQWAGMLWLIDQGGFACAVGAEQGKNLAPPNIQVQSVQGLMPVCVLFAQASNTQNSVRIRSVLHRQ